MKIFLLNNCYIVNDNNELQNNLQRLQKSLTMRIISPSAWVGVRHSDRFDSLLLQRNITTSLSYPFRLKEPRSNNVPDRHCPSYEWKWLPIPKFVEFVRRRSTQLMSSYHIYTLRQIDIWNDNVVNYFHLAAHLLKVGVGIITTELEIISLYKTSHRVSDMVFTLYSNFYESVVFITIRPWYNIES